MDVGEESLKRVLKSHNILNNSERTHQFRLTACIVDSAKNIIFQTSSKVLINFNQRLSSKFHGCELLQLLSIPTNSLRPKLLLLPQHEVVCNDNVITMIMIMVSLCSPADHRPVDARRLSPPSEAAQAAPAPVRAGRGRRSGTRGPRVASTA